MSSDGLDLAADEDGPGDDERIELAARVEVLQEETDRLRDRLAESRQTQHRQAALGLATLGVLAAVAGAFVPGSRTVLLALAGTGLFLGVITYFLTPERFIAADVGESTYAAYAETVGSLSADLGLQDQQIYVPVDGRTKLFVPQREGGTVPDADALADALVVTDDPDERGLSVTPAGDRLFESFERDLAGEAATDLDALCDELADALVEGFELVTSARADVDGDGDGASLRVTDSAYGSVDRFDHPVASLFGVGVARTLDRPVELTVVEPDSGRGDYLIRCEPVEE